MINENENESIKDNEKNQDDLEKNINTRVE